MTTRATGKLEWQAIESRRERVRSQAEEIVARLGLKHPVDPLVVAAAERPMLTCRGGDFGNQFDGQLEYHPRHDRFLLFFNTKYDQDPRGTRHHPRTRFSVAHELGHYFIDGHRAHFLRGGAPHGSRSEFAVDVAMEREADAFASGILLPTALLKPMVNQEEPSLELVRELAGEFHTSLVSTAIRVTQVSHFPMAAVGLREGSVAWAARSQAMIDAGLYPPERGGHGSLNAQTEWERFQAGEARNAAGSSFARDWFRTYDRDGLERVHVTEAYLPVPSMNTLVVLLTVPEDEVYEEEDEELDED